MNLSILLNIHRVSDKHNLRRYGKLFGQFESNKYIHLFSFIFIYFSPNEQHV
jgi:hypothetical protein